MFIYLYEAFGQPRPGVEMDTMRYRIDMIDFF